MDIIQGFDDFIDNLNDSNSCGLCFSYKPSGRHDYFNNIKLNDGEECCVQFAVLSIKHTLTIDNLSNKCRYIVKCFAGIPSRLDIQFYNENEAYPIEDGKWDKYIQPINECFGCDINNLCATIDAFDEYYLVSFEKEMQLNYTDLNLDGWLMTFTFEQNA